MLSIQPNFTSMAFRKKNSEPNYAPKVNATGMTDSVSFTGAIPKGFSEEQLLIIKKLGETLRETFLSVVTVTRGHLKMHRANNTPEPFVVEGSFRTGDKTYAVTFNNPTFHPERVSYINIEDQAKQGFEFHLQESGSRIGNVYSFGDTGRLEKTFLNRELKRLFDEALNVFKTEG